MNRAERRRAGREAGKALCDSMGRTASGDVLMLDDVRVLLDGGIELPPIKTDPGCYRPEHRLEVEGAMMAMVQGYRWKGRTRMDCGCWLSID